MRNEKASEYKKKKALTNDITILSKCASSSGENAIRRQGLRQQH